jgi:hypothetical protein
MTLCVTGPAFLPIVLTDHLSLPQKVLCPLSAPHKSFVTWFPFLPIAFLALPQHFVTQLNWPVIGLSCWTGPVTIYPEFTPVIHNQRRSQMPKSEDSDLNNHNKYSSLLTEWTVWNWWSGWYVCLWKKTYTSVRALRDGWDRYSENYVMIKQLTMESKCNKVFYLSKLHMTFT